MVVIKCPMPGCTFETSDEEAILVAALLNIHAMTHSQAAAQTRPKLDRPHIDAGVDQEIWNNFEVRWKAFRTGSNISIETASTQLFQCASDALGDLILKADPGIQSRPMADVLKTMKSFAVVPVAKGVIRAELMQLQQAPDEQFRTFAARVQGKAQTCGFKTSTKCECGRTVSGDYTLETVRDVLLAGIADIDIRREALCTIDIQDKSVNDVIAFIEGREMARNATPLSSLSALSSFKRENAPKPILPLPTGGLKTVPCPDCKSHFQPFKERSDGSWNQKPHKQCMNCWRAHRRRNPRHPATGAASLSTEVDAEIIQISTIQCDKSQNPEQSVSLNHKIFEKSEWRATKISEHPRATFQLSHAESTKHGLPQKVTINGIADTGAQSNLWGLRDFKEKGFSKTMLHPVKVNIRAANKNNLKIVGAFRGLFEGQTPAGETISCVSLIYVSDCVSGFYLSFDTMVELLMLDRHFPSIGSCPRTPEEAPSTPNLQPRNMQVNQVRLLNGGCTDPPLDSQSCKCPQRSTVPSRPTSLPFSPTPENNERMRDWLLNHFASSTFNTCPHRPLPCMAGPPVEIHIEDSAKPRTCHTAASIPLHWQERVHRDLLRDEALGVIEKVPYGEPVSWCHRMVVTRKHDGSPRRTVDLSPLNKFCKRETFASESPFQLARRVPGNTWKTVTDAWNGYHSVPLRETDRHLTTFITPFGRWRYTRAPQGFLSSGDGYNRRFDAILSDFIRKERCVDDTVHYDEDLEAHWWRTIDFLSVTGSSGIVLNPDKFQFAKREVDFAGFHISEESIEPLPKYLDAIRSFPTPTCTTDIRSWFGLVNQVSNYAQLRDVMAHFRPFLSPKYKFFWSPVLDKAFIDSKEAIISMIRKGVEMFDLTKPTCLRPDWSLRGIGYFLLQKHCSCSTDTPACCTDGWKVTLAGSRFLSGAEQRYAPIEGEALAIAWGLEQTRYFTQGCPDLLIVTDHKPLTKIFGDRTLDEIQNTRLFRLKQRTLPWHFRIEHMPGKTNCAADAASRYPSPDTQINTSFLENLEEPMIAASICKDTEGITAISWPLLAQETEKDQVLVDLRHAIGEGSIQDQPTCNEYARYKDYLYSTDGVILYKDRVVVPSSLRQTILEGLHSAHQGVSSMELRAQSIVFWPGMTNDIQQIRARCRECNRNAPSQAPLPSEPATPPSTPFEQVFADFFDFAGHHYLVVGDRLSGWPEIFSTPTGSSHAGSRGLIACLRRLFSTFGVPEELSSDGGPEFVASATQEFLTRWGVKHRKSSAYHPQSNGRAEVAVKSAKRLLRSNVNPSGTLDSDRLLRALLQLRNTPDPDCNISPAQIIFGRPIRDAFSFTNRLEKFSNPAIHPTWREAWASKEAALRTRFTRTSEKINEHAKELPPIGIGKRCFVQNQTGNTPKKWDRTGVVMEQSPHDQYIVKIDGSGRLTTRNRRFLRTFEPASTVIESAPPSIPRPCPSTAIPDPQLAPEPPGPEMDALEDPPQSTSPTPCTPHASPQPAPTRKVPAALSRILDYNKPGIKEAAKPPSEGGRATRRSTMNLGGM